MKNEKASQKTEDEVINETFGGFDEDMTEQTTEQTQNSDVAAPFAKKKTGSSNTLVFAGAGVGAVLVLGWMFFIKPAMAPNEQAVSQPDTMTVASNTAPTVPSSLPVSNPDSPESKAASQFLSGQTATPNILTPATVTAPTAPTTVTVPIAPVTQATVVAPTVVNPAVENKAPEVAITKNNATSAAVVSELSNLFETQSKQVKIAINDMGNKVQLLETFNGEQKFINQNVEERLVKLESIGGAKKSVVSVKSPVKKQMMKSYTNKVSNPVNLVNQKNDSSVLIDKTDAVVMGKKSVIVTNEVQNMSDFNVHSIYGNRVWLKNADGSLSTYSSGDKLPNGELIKGIDDENFSVTTDKRKISKR